MLKFRSVLGPPAIPWWTPRDPGKPWITVNGVYRPFGNSALQYAVIAEYWRKQMNNVVFQTPTEIMLSYDATSYVYMYPNNLLLIHLITQLE